eukprot:2054508-Amphidinium_carterae.1
MENGGMAILFPLSKPYSASAAGRGRLYGHPETVTALGSTVNLGTRQRRRKAAMMQLYGVLNMAILNLPGMRASSKVVTA